LKDDDYVIYSCNADVVIIAWRLRCRTVATCYIIIL